MMPSKAPELIIFDCDGVLVDSEPISFDALYEMMVEQGIQISQGELKRLSIGRSVRTTVEAIKTLYGKTIENVAIDAMNATLRRRLSRDLMAIAGVRSALAKIAVPKCVASSSGLPRIHVSLRKTGMLDDFRPNIFSADMVDVGKPAPDLFLLAARTMGASPSRCIVVEDSPAGIEAAHRAGMRAFAFCGGSHVDEDLIASVRACDPDLIFADMGDLPLLVGSPFENSSMTSVRAR